MSGGPSAGAAGRAGRSRAKRSLWRVTSSGPLRVWKRITLRPGSVKPEITKAVASVAWPHSDTSVVGVNQRSS